MNPARGSGVLSITRLAACWGEGSDRDEDGPGMGRNQCLAVPRSGVGSGKGPRAEAAEVMSGDTEEVAPSRVWAAPAGRAHCANDKEEASSISSTLVHSSQRWCWAGPRRTGRGEVGGGEERGVGLGRLSLGRANRTCLSSDACHVSSLFQLSTWLGPGPLLTLQ